MARSLVNTVGGGSSKLTIPVGGSVPFSGGVVPTGFLLCDGATFSKSTYPDLYTAIGNIYNEYETIDTDNPDPTVNAFAGQSPDGVAISSDGTRVVIARENIVSTGVFLVYYDYDGTTLSNPVSISSPADATAQTLGEPSVRLSGDGTVLIVGYGGKTVGGFDFQGALYVYRWNGASYDLEQTIDYPGAPSATNRTFGRRIGISNDGTKIAGLTQGANSSAFIFKYDGVSSWNLEDTIIAGTASANGVGLDFNDDGTKLVFGFADNGVDNGGFPKIYTFGGSTWSIDTELRPLLTNLDTNYHQAGYSVSMSSEGNKVVLGTASSFANGKAWALSSDGSVWTLDKELTVAIQSSNDGFGTSVAVSEDGSVIAIGSRNSDINGSQDGAMFIFKSNISGVEQTKEVLGTGSAGERFGAAVAIDSEGSCIISSSPIESTGLSNSGMITALSGEPKTPTLLNPGDVVGYVIKASEE